MTARFRVLLAFRLLFLMFFAHIGCFFGRVGRSGWILRNLLWGPQLFPILSGRFKFFLSLIRSFIAIAVAGEVCNLPPQIWIYLIKGALRLFSVLMMTGWVRIASEDCWASICTDGLVGPIRDDFRLMMSDFTSILILADVLFFHKLCEALRMLFRHTCLVADLKLWRHWPVLHVDTAILFLLRALSLLNLLEELLMVDSRFLSRAVYLDLRYWNVVAFLMVSAFGGGFETMTLTVNILADIKRTPAAHQLLILTH